MSAPEDAISPSQEYIDRLKDQLDAANRALKNANANWSKAKKEHGNALTWKGLLETQWKSIQLTHELANSLLIDLESMEAQARNVCSNVECMQYALILFIRELRDTVVKVEELAALMKNLMDRVACLTDPVLNPNESIMLHLTNLQKMIEESLVMLLDGIRASLKAIQAGNLLKLCICNDKDGDYGLIFNLVQIIDLLKTATRCGPSRQADIDESQTIGECTITLPDPDCRTEQKPYVLCEAGEDCESSEYWQETKQDYETACQLVKEKKCVVDHYNNCRELAQAQYDAISTALKAAQEAKAC
ncbi:MAG: hypothetical protein KDD15_01700 [Lewinella sp.]|nr:hypothetical protein [Lewinella sp.]